MLKRKTPVPEQNISEFPEEASMDRARRLVNIHSGSHEKMLKDLKSLKALLLRVRNFKTENITDEKIKFETEAGLEVAISKLKLALHVEDLDSILLRK